MFSRIFPAIVVLGLFFLFGSNAIGQTTVSGTNLGAIPDSQNPDGCQFPGPPRDVTFSVTGMPMAPSSVSLELLFNPAHPWGGDIVATLISPDNTQFVVFGYTGISSPQGTFDGGDGSDLAGPYVFSDSATGNWWAAADTADDDEPIPAGSYRTSAIGGTGSTGTQTSMNAAFASIPTSNGTWVLRLTDGCSPDTGGISSAKLTLAAAPTGIRQDANVDMNGLGRTDFVVTRIGSGTASGSYYGSRRPLPKRDRILQDLSMGRIGTNTVDPNIEWWTLFSDAGGYSYASHGNAITDWTTPADFDGDDKADIAVWRPGDADEAGFLWINSSDSTLGTAIFGLSGDDPTVVGDYDGDNKADPAVFRCPSTTAGQCYFFYRGTNNNPGNNITYWPLGYGVIASIFPMSGDFDGDGRFDFCVFRSKPGQPSQGQFVLQPSSNLNSVEYIEYGLIDLDFLVPGDYDGDGRSDFAVARPENGHWNFYVLERDGGGNPAAPTQFGLVDDTLAPGDYDGDGRTDLAVYRRAEGSENSTFWVLRSTNNQLLVQPFGLADDVPAAAWRIFQ